MRKVDFIKQSFATEILYHSVHLAFCCEVVQLLYHGGSYILGEGHCAERCGNAI